MVHPSPMVDTVDCDFLIVGAGSSGCVLASRLVRAGLKVLLVEKGPTDAATLSKLVTRPADWLRAAFTGRGLSEAFLTVPQAGLNNRYIVAPRGQGGGGTSNVNVGLYQRGRYARRLAQGVAAVNGKQQRVLRVCGLWRESQTRVLVSLTCVFPRRWCLLCLMISPFFRVLSMFMNTTVRASRRRSPVTNFIVTWWRDKPDVT